MNKEQIMIRRINHHTITEKPDEVAVEQSICILLGNGEKVHVTCSPSHMEEMILGRRFLEGDVSLEELPASVSKTETLKEVGLKEIFGIAKGFFENPGPLFVETGCAHSCALIYQGKVVCHIEDIGRHNALDKVIGYALLHQIPIKESYIFSSGRISGDYLEKVIAAGFFMVVSRAAVTGNAVALAKEKNITMLGFIREHKGNLYHEGAVKICNDIE